MKFERLSKYKTKKIIECFAENITATSASKILKLNRKTANQYYNEFRQKILEKSHEEPKKELGVFEIDESYFEREESVENEVEAGKTPLFGLLKRNGKVFVTIVPNCSREELMPIIQGKILEGNDSC